MKPHRIDMDFPVDYECDGYMCSSVEVFCYDNAMYAQARLHATERAYFHTVVLEMQYIIAKNKLLHTYTYAEGISEDGVMQCMNLSTFVDLIEFMHTYVEGVYRSISK